MTDHLDILFQDEYLVAINKPSGLLVHRSEIDRHETRFAVQLLRNQIGQQVFPLHRLDKPTSGVLLFALSSAVAQQLAEQFRNHSIRKTYLALVRGHCLGDGEINHPLREDPDEYAGRKEPGPALEAITHFRHLAAVELPIAVDKYPSSRYSLVECHPLTGRKHQIRRHLKHINHPIIGDAKHGKGRHNRMFQEEFGVHRLLLAATQLDFIHPQSQRKLQICAPLDSSFLSLIKRFGWHAAVPAQWL